MKNKGNSMNNTELMIQDFESTQQLCQALLKTKHYQKMGSEGIFAIVQKAKAIGIDPMEALNGSCYYVQGKVELTSTMMNQLIRRAGHSIACEKLDDEECILVGKRKDNGDTWISSFSVKEAQKAGIYRNQWLKYTKDMLFARALSRLARQLFPDLVHGCYVSGEVSETISLAEEINDEAVEIHATESKIDEEKAGYLDQLIGTDDEFRKRIMDRIFDVCGATELVDMPIDLYDKVLAGTLQHIQTKGEEE